MTLPTLHPPVPIAALLRHAAENPRLHRGQTVRVFVYLVMSGQLDWDEYRPIKQYQVGRRLRLKPHSVGRCLDRLELAGYLIHGPRRFPMLHTYRLSHPDTPNL